MTDRIKHNSKLFQQRLQKELDARVRKNPKYSMRAFAKFLEIDFSTLSKILRGQRVIGAELILRLGSQLKLSNSEIQNYLQMGVVQSNEKDTSHDESIPKTVGWDHLLYSQLTISVDMKKLDTLLEQIQNFQKELTQFLSDQPGNNKELVEIGISLFPINKRIQS